MKPIFRLVLVYVVMAAVGVTILKPSQRALAGCNNEFFINTVTAFRDHIIIEFDMNDIQASPIEFMVTNNGVPVGGTSFTSAVTGTFTVEFDLNMSSVNELDVLDIEGDPDRGCRQFAVATATGLYYLPTGEPAPRILPQCPDGRINYAHCDKIAIYPIKDEGSFGITVLIVDKKVVPEFAIFVAAADLAALPETPDSILTVATSENGLVTLYKHPNGDYQVNYGPDFEGKVFTFRFSGIPASSYPEVTTFMVGALMPRITPTLL